jgi:hypothetical protein
MKQKWWCIRGVVLCAAALAGCGGEEVDPLDPGTFSGMNVEKLHYDCMQTIQCEIQRGQMRGPEAVDNCTKATAAELQRRPEKQMPYLINFSRCQTLFMCDYLACVTANISGGYGMMQMEKVMYNCMQDVECQRQLGTLMGEPTMSINSCVANNIGLLDSFNPMQRQQFESEFMRCGQALACDFTNCFPF